MKTYIFIKNGKVVHKAKFNYWPSLEQIIYEGRDIGDICILITEGQVRKSTRCSNGWYSSSYYYDGNRSI